MPIERQNPQRIVDPKKSVAIKFEGAMENQRVRRTLYFCFMLIGATLNLLPRRLAFLLLMMFDLGRLPNRNRLLAAYRPFTIAFLVENPSWRFSGRRTGLFPSSVARVLFGIGAYREAVEWILSKGLAIKSKNMIKLVGPALFELGEFDRARIALGARLSIVDLERDPQSALLRAMLEVIAGDFDNASANALRANRQNKNLMRPHQNIASRPPRIYFPNTLDVAAGIDGRLFDLCNFTGQRVTHVGRGDIGIGLFERALLAQSNLQAAGAPALSHELSDFLRDLDVNLDDIKIIPEEWVTQIGHLGMLDILFRMQTLGWWSGKPIIVVRPELVANRSFFRLFEEFAKVIVLGESISEQVGSELLSLQRWYGLNFNAFRLPDGVFLPWQDAGALAIEQWEREGRGHPLRDIYDRVFSRSDLISRGFENIRAQWGMKPDDWYVCFHTRDAAHYLEFKGTGQTHRNAPIGTSIDAIRFITARGGWVIKLGGPNSPKLPHLERTVDYALSGFRSDLMDLHLIRNARAFVGTTSGLTNVAVSFGIPCAIVNAITTDAQLWHKDVRFALKPVYLADGTALTQRQLTSAPWRWRVFDAAVLGRHGGSPLNNAADEILEAVKEVEALARGCRAEYEDAYDAERLIETWKRQLSTPYHYGTGRPSLYFLQKHEKGLLVDQPEKD